MKYASQCKFSSQPQSNGETLSLLWLCAYIIWGFTAITFD
jgi:hypothetical protein